MPLTQQDIEEIISIVPVIPFCGNKEYQQELVKQAMLDCLLDMDVNVSAGQERKDMIDILEDIFFGEFVKMANYM